MAKHEHPDWDALQAWYERPAAARRVDEEFHRLWEAAWASCDWSWDGLADREQVKIEVGPYQASVWPKAWLAPLSWPGKRPTWGAENRLYKQASLQDFWRPHFQEPGEDGAPGPWDFDETDRQRLVAAGLPEESWYETETGKRGFASLVAMLAAGHLRRADGEPARHILHIAERSKEEEETLARLILRRAATGALRLDGGRLGDVDGNAWSDAAKTAGFEDGVELSAVLTHFAGNALFPGTHFAGVFFYGARFAVDAWFVGVNFSGYGGFDKASFAAGAGFDWVSFGTSAEFNRVSFGGNVQFNEATFPADAQFHAASFAGTAGFNTASFAGCAEFMEANFAGDADFDKASFTGNAMFNGACFAADAGFRGSRFAAVASFLGASFSADARFGEARFRKRAIFSSARFEHNALFGRSRFRMGAAFERVGFEGDAVFRECNFGEDAQFSEVSIRGVARFGKAQFASEAIFRGVSFERQAVFRAAKFNGHCFFSKQDGKDSVFGGRYEFTDALFKDVANFDKSFLPVDAAQSRRAFYGARFKEPAHFEGFQFQAFGAFDGAMFEKGVFIQTADSKQAKENFRAALAAHAKAVQDSAQADLEKEEGERPNGEQPGWWSRFLARRKQRHEWFDTLEAGSRTLKLAMLVSSNDALVQRFYRQELIARSRKPIRTRGDAVDRLVSLIYGGLSDFGASMGRPFVLFVGQIVVFGVLWRLWSSSGGLVDALSFSARNSIAAFHVWGSDASLQDLFGGFSHHGGGWEWFLVRVIATMQSVLALTLVFLFGLAVRRRFQIS